MTENDPTAHDPATPRPSADAQPGHGQEAATGGWAGSPYGSQSPEPGNQTSTPAAPSTPSTPGSYGSATNPGTEAGSAPGTQNPAPGGHGPATGEHAAYSATGGQGSAGGYGGPGDQDAAGGHGASGGQGAIGGQDAAGGHGASGGYGATGDQGTVGSHSASGGQSGYGVSGDQSAAGGYGAPGGQGSAGGYSGSGEQSAAGYNASAPAGGYGAASSYGEGQGPATGGYAAGYPATGGHAAAGGEAGASHYSPSAASGTDASYGAPQSANPWSAQGAQGSGQVPQQSAPGTGQVPQQGVQGSGQIPQQSAYPSPNPYASPGMSGTSAYGTPAPSQPKRSGGKLLAGVALVALLVGGVAGGTVGYLTGGSSSGPAGNALDAPKPAQQTGNAPSGSVEAVASKLSPSVVELQVSGQQGAGEGSGFVISTDGYILTNNHVVEVAANGGQIQAVFQDGRKSAAKVVGRDPTTDIAVVKVSGISNLTPVEIGRSDDLRVGQSVVAIGSPFELAGTVTSGIVSSLHRPVRAGGSTGDQTTVMDAVQTDAAINPGNSGGPLANMAGQVIGINSAIYSPQSASGGQGQGASEGGNVGIGFAIPIDQARRTADTIIKTGQAVQTYIGAQVKDAPQGGAELGAITPGSPAEKAGLKSGDIVTKIDDRNIDSSDTLVAAIRTRAPDEKATFTLQDGRTVEVTLGGQPVPAN